MCVNSVEVKKEMKNHKIKLGCFFFFQMVLLIIAICVIKRPYFSYSCQGEELVTNGAIFLHDFIDGLQNGYYIDDTMVTDEIRNDDDLSLYIATPEIDFQKGSYEVKIYYSSQEKINTYTAFSKHNTRDIRIGNVQKGVNGSEGCHVFGFESSQDVEDYQVKVKYCNSNYIFINRIDINETNDWRCKILVGIVTSLFMMNFVYVAIVKNWKIISKEYISIIIVLGIIALLAGIPSLYRGIYSGHDTFVHVARMEGLKEALKEGIFPVRMQNFFFDGYGYPISIYYGDLLLYIPAFLRILGFDVQTCFNGYILLINFMTCLTMYFSTSKIFRNKTYGILAAFVYVLAPYRLSCLYLRGAIGEATAMLFYPIIVYALYRIFSADSEEQNNRWDWVWLSVGFSGLVYSHMISTIITGMFTFIICVVFFKRTFSKDCFIKLCKAVVLAVLLCAEFLIPLLEYLGENISMNEVERSGMFQGHGAYLSQLLNIMPHGYGIAFSDTKMLENEVEMSYAIGIVFVFSLVAFLLYLINYRRENNNISIFGKTMFGCAVLAIFMSTIFFPWDAIEKMGTIFSTITKTIQFPWRILGIATIALSFLTVCVVEKVYILNGKELLNGIISFILLGMLTTSGYWMNDFMNTNSMSFIRYSYEVGDRSVGQGEYMPNDIEYSMFNDLSIWHDDSIVANLVERTNSKIIIECNNNTNQEQYVDVPFIYYKDYVAKDILNNKKLQTMSGESGRVRVVLPQEYSGHFEVYFESPWYWRVCEVISFSTVIVLVVYIYLKKKEKVRNMV